MTCYVVTANVNAYVCTSNNACTLVRTIPAGTDVFIQCVGIGQVVNGDSQWDYVGLSTTGVLVGYVSDDYVYCGGGVCAGPSC